MRYLLTLLAGAAVGFLLAWAFHVDDVRPIVEAPTLRAPTPHLVEQTEERLQPHAPVTLSTPAAERRAVPAHDEHDLAEAIAEAEATRAQYDALLADDGRAAMQLRMEEAEGEVNALRGRIAWLERELALATLDPATVWGPPFDGSRMVVWIHDVPCFSKMYALPEFVPGGSVRGAPTSSVSPSIATSRPK